MCKGTESVCKNFPNIKEVDRVVLITHTHTHTYNLIWDSPIYYVTSRCHRYQGKLLHGTGTWCCCCRRSGVRFIVTPLNCQQKNVRTITEPDAGPVSTGTVPKSQEGGWRSASPLTVAWRCVETPATTVRGEKHREARASRPASIYDAQMYLC